MGLKALPFFWGLAEALIFFIVPDVWLTILARRKLSPGVVAAFYALAGALAGGTVIYLAGSAEPDLVRRMMVKVPGIDAALVSEVSHSLKTSGLTAILLGPVRGIPYKLYAFQAGHAGIGLPSFLAVSVPARLIRFLMVTLFAHYCLKAVKLLCPGVDRLAVLLVSWLLFYLLYFYRMGI